MKNLWILPALLALGTGTAFAQETAESRVYAGVGIGWSSVDERGLDDDDTALKVFGAYRFTDWLDAEVAYVNLGEFEDGGSLEADGFQFSGLANFRVSPQAGVFAKAGLYAWDSSGSGLGFADDTGIDPVIGFGGRYRLGGNLGVRAEYERFYDVDDADVDVVTVSATYDF